MTEDANVRIARLERLVFMLAEALVRQGTEIDGAHGHPPSDAVFEGVAFEMNKVFMSRPNEALSSTAR